MFLDSENCTISIIGLGYVGLPLAIRFAQTNISLRTGNKLNRKIIGFDINEKRITELKNGIDKTNEIDSNTLELCKSNITFTTNIDLLVKSDVFIITVPTPIDKNKTPDLNAIKNASKIVGKTIANRKEKQLVFPSPYVIFESTVYPGATEEVCIPIIQNFSGLNIQSSDDGHSSFYCGYSPERINPGDKKHTIEKITKVTSGNTPFAAEWIDNLYGSIIEAGTHKAQSIKVAEAAKVIENIQRDINIALVNELAMILNLLKVDTLDVLEAAGSKWNFLKFRPGLVGGHCIGVDPYYLTYKAKQLGYDSQIVLSGRRLNESMSEWIVKQVIRNMGKKGIDLNRSKILILGFTFKENCSDVRNTKVLDIIRELESFGINPDVVDPFAGEDPKVFYNIKTDKEIDMTRKYDVIILAVAHKIFVDLSYENWTSILKDKYVIFDLKGIIPRNLNPIRI